MNKRDVDGMKNAKKYHGYLALPRHSKLLRQHLGYRLYHYYLELVTNAIWHRNNPQIGHVIGTQLDLAKILEVSQSTVSRILDSFDEKDRKYVLRRSRYFLLGYFHLFLTDVAGKMAKKDYATLNELYADMHKINAELQENYATSQEKRDRNTTQSFYRSSNVNLDSSQHPYDRVYVDEVAEEIEGEKEGHA